MNREAVYVRAWRLVGVLASALARDLAPEDAARRANAAAALAVTRPGPATAPTTTEIDQLVRASGPQGLVVDAIRPFLGHAWNRVPCKGGFPGFQQGASVGAGRGRSRAGCRNGASGG